jgi:hypothetical protein
MWLANVLELECKQETGLTRVKHTSCSVVPTSVTLILRALSIFYLIILISLLQYIGDDR